jgi:ATP sulfurylase
MKIGLIPLSAKPYHRGHDMLVRLASSECDEVRLFVSTSDRDNVSGEAMECVWVEHIEPSLPNNVYVEYGGSPVRKVWSELGESNEFAALPEDFDNYVIYSDPVDITNNFPEEKLRKYVSKIYNAGYIELRPVDRTTTMQVSGADCRRMLNAGDRKGFVDMMPVGIDGNAVWDILYNQS